MLSNVLYTVSNRNKKPEAEQTSNGPYISTSSQDLDNEISPDSGYSSNPPNTSTRRTSKLKEGTPIKLGGRALLRFMDDSGQSVRARFEDLRGKVLPLLSDELRARGVSPGNVSIRHMILGATRDDAHDYVVVLCDHKSLKAVRRVFDGERVIRDLLDSSDNDKCSFKVILEGSPPRLRALLSTVWVEIAEAGYEAFPGTGETLCGQPLRLINPVNDIRYTTFGGVIKVVDKSNEATFYGMTTGHGISSLEPEDFAISKMMDCWGSSETEAETEPETESSDNDESGFSRHVPSIVDHKRWQRLGMAFTGRSQSNKYSDLALHELRHGSLLPNMICTRETKGKIRKRPLSTKVGMVTAESSKILVELIGGHKGSRNGVLWNQPAGLLVGPDMLPVDAYMVTLNKGSISDGDSGSWVVGSRSLEPYGHVIADDVFGDIYMVPLNTAMASIQEYLQAKAVHLPSSNEMWLSRAMPNPRLILSKNSPADPKGLSRYQEHGAIRLLDSDTTDSGNKHDAARKYNESEPFETETPQELETALKSPSRTQMVMEVVERDRMLILGSAKARREKYLQELQKSHCPRLDSKQNSANIIPETMKRPFPTITSESPLEYARQSFGQPITLAPGLNAMLTGFDLKDGAKKVLSAMRQRKSAPGAATVSDRKDPRGPGYANETIFKNRKPLFDFNWNRFTSVKETKNKLSSPGFDSASLTGSTYFDEQASLVRGNRGDDEIDSGLGWEGLTSSSRGPWSR